MPQPPGERRTPEEGEGVLSSLLKTAMEGIKVGGDEMDKREVAEADKDYVEAERGGLGGAVGTESHRATDLGC